MRNKLALFSIISLALWHGNAIAAITLTNGYWSTSFIGCTTGNARYGYNCDGLEISDEAYPNDSCGGTYSQVGTSGNFLSGAGGSGLRVYMEGNNRNSMSAPAVLYFPALPELWLRFYYRIPAGQRSGNISEHKLIFPFIGGSVSSPVDWPSGSNISMTMQGTMGNQDIYFNSGGGWPTIYGGPPATTPADGSWHYYEFHFKKPTSGATGVFQMWVDGINYVNKTDMDWGTGAGWTRIIFPHNHNTWQLPGCNGHDIDDIAVANPSYTGFVHDSAGRNMIGGLQGGKKPSPVMNIIPPPSN